jgi:hypothetical protein
MNFGQATFVKSDKQNNPPQLIYNSIAHPGKRYKFYRNANYTSPDGVETVYYCCLGCAQMNAAKIPSVSVRNGLLFTDPDAPRNAAHSCIPSDIVESKAVQLINQEARVQIQESELVKIAPHQS